MVKKKKRKYTMEIVFGSLVLVILLAIFIPSILGNSGSEQTSPPGDTPKEGLEVPIEEHDPVLGEEEAPVTVVEFVDYQCPTCKASAEQTLTKLKEDYIESGEVRYVLKDFPLTSHPNAIPAAVAVRAAGEQEKYWEMHDLMFERQSEWSELGEAELNETLTAYAEELELDAEQFQQDLDSDALKNQVVAGRQLGDILGIRYTPTAIVNGKMYEEPIAPGELEDVIEAARNQSGNTE